MYTIGPKSHAPPYRVRPRLLPLGVAVVTFHRGSMRLSQYSDDEKSKGLFSFLFSFLFRPSRLFLYSPFRLFLCLRLLSRYHLAAEHMYRVSTVQTAQMTCANIEGQWSYHPMTKASNK